MNDFNVTILGCGSASPTTRHYPSCQAVSLRERVMLLDCGEGAQQQMRRYRVPMSKITDIFISHLHGDHFFGLAGLLSTLSLHEVGGTIRVHAFAPGLEVLEKTLNLFCRERSYTLELDALSPDGGIVVDAKGFTVRSFPLYHRVPCVGFMIAEKPKLRHIDADACAYFKVPVYYMQRLREGENFVRADGVRVPNRQLTKDASPSYSYAYCSDTAYDPRIGAAIRGVDVLYHEATYGEELAAKAAPRGHSTACQAARTALEAAAKKLYIGHYSQQIEDPQVLVAEARTIFPDTEAAYEGLRFDVQ